MAKTNPRQTNRARRISARRSMQQASEPWWNLLMRRQVIFATLYGLIFVVIASWITMSARSEPKYRIGQIVDQPIYARLNFEVRDELRTEQERQKASRGVYARVNLNESFIDETRRRLRELPEKLAEIESADQIADEEINKYFDISDEALKQIKQSGNWVAAVRNYLEQLQRTVILRSDQYDRVRSEQEVPLVTRPRLGTIREDVAQPTPLSEESELRKRSEELAQYAFGRGPLAEAISPYLTQANQATYTLDEAATEQARAQAASQTQPVTSRFEHNGRPLVESGEPLDLVHYDLLAEERDLYMSAMWQQSPWRWFALRAGPVALVIFLTGGLIAWTAAMRPRIGENPMRGLAMTVLILLGLTVAWSVRSMTPYFDAMAPFIAVLLVGMVVAVVYDRIYALGVATLAVLLVALALRHDAAMVMAGLATVAVAIGQLGELRHRGVLVRIGVITGLFAAISYSAAAFVMHDLQIPGLTIQIAYSAVLAFMGALLVGFVILGMLPVIERVFKVTTAMTLLELCDMNQPLLRRLAANAPGTFNHSLQIATMAEAAADAIGADGLLCRVGAYYHDIGKINKPHYFVENQAGGPNRHDKLSPAMSLLIIVGHVKDGVEMAKEYGLPPTVVHFIESHHGTTLVEYFYHAAKQKTEQGGEETPSEFEYRYPGPKPRTREAAILMLSDSIEASARAMSEPTAGRIEQLVTTMATKRLMDGQFDECNLTLDELRRIEMSITKTLTGVYHGRIAYPSKKSEDDEQPAKPAASSG